jgi:ABC-type dipeptide/oligopeptide/nickel transport system permease component
MWRHIISRLVQTVLALVALTLLVFLSAHLTGDPASYYLRSEASSRADYERLKVLLGLDRPLLEQYAQFLVNAIQGDLGTSIYLRRPVSELIASRLPATLLLAASGLALALAIGIPTGVVAAMRPGGRLDRILTMVSVIGMSAPQFWVGVLLLTLFAATLRWLPSYGAGSPKHLILPMLTLSLPLIAGIVRLTRSGMISVLDSDYVRFARMKGLPERTVVWSHALRNAMFPVLTFAGITLGTLLNGAIVIEKLFAWPGIGQLMLDSVVRRDFPILQGTVLVGGSLFIATSFLVDLLYAALDPRLRRN